MDAIKQLVNTIRTTHNVAVTHGVAAGLISALFSGLPSLAYWYVNSPTTDAWWSGYVLKSMQAAGNVLLRDKSTSKPVMMAVGVMVHFALSMMWSVIMSLATRTVKGAGKIIATSMAIALAIHYFDLYLMPAVWHMPIMGGYLRETGTDKHFWDHISFGAVTGAALAMLRDNAMPALMRNLGKMRAAAQDAGTPSVSSAMPSMPMSGLGTTGTEATVGGETAGRTKVE